MMRLKRDFFSRYTPDVARDLLFQYPRSRIESAFHAAPPSRPIATVL